MDILQRATIILVAWGVVFVFANPFFEDPRKTKISAAFLGAASLCFIAGAFA